MEPGVSAAGQWKAAAEVFEGMAGGGCKPDSVTYGTLITALDRGGQWTRALEVPTQVFTNFLKGLVHMVFGQGVDSGHVPGVDLLCPAPFMATPQQRSLN